MAPWPPCRGPRAYLPLTARGPGSDLPGRTASWSWPGPVEPGLGGVNSVAGLPFRDQVPERSTAGTREVHGCGTRPRRSGLAIRRAAGNGDGHCDERKRSRRDSPARSWRGRLAALPCIPGSPNVRRLGTPAQRLLGGQQVPAGCPGSLRGGPVTGKAGGRPCDPGRWLPRCGSPRGPAAANRRPRAGGRTRPPGPALAGGENGPDWLAAGRIFRQRTQAVAVAVGIQ
jgi:hypothetical protein